MQTVRDDMEKVNLYLSLGSNQGDRRHNIEIALSLLNIELKKPYIYFYILIEYTYYSIKRKYFQYIWDF